MTGRAGQRGHCGTEAPIQLRRHEPPEGTGRSGAVHAISFANVTDKRFLFFIFVTRSKFVY